jgi:hypothetical protein
MSLKPEHNMPTPDNLNGEIKLQPSSQNIPSTAAFVDVSDKPVGAPDNKDTIFIDQEGTLHTGPHQPDSTV